MGNNKDIAKYQI